MTSRLSLGLAIFKKALGNSTTTRCIFHAEYDTESGAFIFTKILLVQRRARLVSSAKQQESCSDVVTCLKHLTTASENAVLDGYKFDLSGMRLFDAEAAEDEDWGTALSTREQRPSMKIKKRH